MLGCTRLRAASRSTTCSHPIPADEPLADLDQVVATRPRARNRPAGGATFPRAQSIAARISKLNGRPALIHAIMLSVAR